MERCRYLPNVQDFLADWKTRYERRFGEPFEGAVSPFGAMVEYYPISSRIQSMLHQSGKKVSLGILTRICIHRGAEFGKGDILVADFEELEKMDLSEIHAPRLNAQE